MPSTTLRDNHGQTIGTKEDHGGGKWSIRDSHGQTKDTYDSKTDRTYNSHGQFVGTGDQLSSLLDKR